MSQWKEYKLGEIGKIITGTTPQTKNPENYGGFMLFVTPTDFDAYNKTINNSIRSISEIAVKKLKNRIIPKDSVIVTCIGSQMGKVAINKKDCLTNKQINSIIPNKGFDSNFIYYTLKSMQDYLRNLATGGSTMPIINKSSFENITISVPDYPTQTAIASILSSLDEKIELNNAINRNLEALAQALFKQWFVDFNFPVDEYGNFSPLSGEMSEGQRGYKDSGGEMVESELGMIPKGWNIQSLSSTFDFLEGPGLRNWQYKDEGMPFINIRLIQDGNLKVDNASCISFDEFNKKYRHFELREYDFVISTSGTLGKSAIVRKSHLPIMLNTSVIRFRPLINNSRCFMYQYLQSKAFLKELVSQASGSVQLNFGPMHIKRINLIVPNEKTLRLFERISSNIYEKILINREENNYLSKIRDTLLPKLISGELEVNEAEKILTDV